MKKPDKFELDVQSIQCTLEALTVLREAFEVRSAEEGVTKKQFSEWVGKDPSYVSRILNGRVANVNYQTIARMLLALNFYPRVGLQDVDTIGHIVNYRPCDEMKDDYDRIKTNGWRKMVNEADDGQFLKSKISNRPVLSNG